MTMDFRCDKCGKMLKLHGKPSERVRCTNCGCWTRVPALFGQLPRPHVKPDARSVTIAVKDETEAASPVALAAIGSSMPWLLSALTHVGVFLVMLFIMLIVQHPQEPDPPLGKAFNYAPPPPTGKIKKTEGGDSKAAAADRRLIRQRPTREIQIAAGSTTTKVVLENPFNGPGRSLTGLDILDGNTSGGGLYGIKGPQIAGGPVNIVYVVDRSGSMAPRFQEVRWELIRSISQLEPGHKFHIVLFGDGKTIEGPNRWLIAPEMRNRLAAARFLKKQTAVGTTTALVALKRAFAVLASAPGDESRLIYLLSDGDFSGLAGGSSYRTRDGRRLDGNEAVLQWLADNNAGPKVHINTVLLHSTDPTAVKVLKTIAKQNGGRFKYVSPDE